MSKMPYILECEALDDRGIDSTPHLLGQNLISKSRASSTCVDRGPRGQSVRGAKDTESRLS